MMAELTGPITRNIKTRRPPVYQTSVRQTPKQSTKKMSNTSTEEENINSLIASWDSTKWQNIEPQLRNRLTTALRECLKSSKLPLSALIDLSAADSCKNSTLADILNNPTDCNLTEYCTNTSCDILWVQLYCLAQAGCREFALKLCIGCEKRTEMGNDDRIRDMHCTLLFQMDLFDKLTIEMRKNYTCEQGIEFANRLLASPEDGAVLFASCVISTFLAVDLLSQNDRLRVKKLMEMWINVDYQLDRKSLNLKEKVTMLSRTFTSSEHYYLLVEVLFRKFGKKFLHFYIELYLKAMTIDLNSLETVRSKGGADVGELEVHFADVLSTLAIIVGVWSMLARECYLSAFSVDPTRERLNHLGDFKESCGTCHCIIKGACGQKGAKSRVVCDLVDELPQVILEDLTIVLSYQRNKALSWEIEWPVFKKRCAEHFERKKAKNRSCRSKKLKREN